MRSHPCVARVATLSLGLAFGAAGARAQDTERVSTDSAGNEGDDQSYSVCLSFDGSVVAFASAATNLVPSDTNQRFDVFVNDRAKGIVSRVSVDSGGAEADGDSRVYWGRSLSGDGSVVAFESVATNLVANDTNGTGDIFVHDRTTGVTERVNVRSGGGQANAQSFLPSLSADGQVVAFESVASNLVNGDTNGTYDVFVHERSTARTFRVSVDSSGNEGNSASD
jgi:hypothetical protein